VRRGDKRYVRLTVTNDGEDVIRLAGDMAILAKAGAKGNPIALPDVPVLPGSRRYVDLDLPVQWSADALARVRIELDGIGELIGQCPLDPDKVQLVP
ncbi:MAG TPA: hypothetical protein VFP10_12860, partial [Candidatus Eisenbacteria bacterium]|nr:hypothetical protein [Candidatus Eisenbacteria bacterium]